MRGKLSKLNWEFDSCILEDSNTILIGIPHDAIPSLKGLELEEYPQIINNLDMVAKLHYDLYSNINDYEFRLLNLSKDNQQFLIKMIEKLISMRKIKQHVGYNFFAVLNFLSARYQVSLANIIVNDPLPNEISPSAFEIDNIVKLRNAVSPISNQRLINYQCACHLITPSILYSGEGTLYTVRKPENVSSKKMDWFYDKVTKRIADAVDKDNKGQNINIKKLLLQDGIVTEDCIDEWTVKTYLRYWSVPDDIAELINYLLDEMKVNKVL